MDVKNMKKILRKALKEEKMKNEKDNLTKAFLAAAIATVATGLVFIIIMVITLIDMGATMKSYEAEKYDLNCVTQPIEKPLTDCKE